jgi:hypothetical protein
VVLVKSVQVDIGVKGDTESKAKLDAITKKAEDLKRAFPEYKLKIDSAAASEKLRLFKAQLAEATKDRTANVKVKVDESALSKFAKKMQGAGGPSWLGPALLLAPAATTLGGVGLAAGAGLAGAFTAGAGALAAFGAVAKPVLTSAKTAADAVTKAQQNYQAVIAAGVPKAQAQLSLQTANSNAMLTYKAALAGGAKPATALAALHVTLAKNQLAYNSATNAGTFGAKAYAAEQAAIGKAYAGLSPQQIALSRQLGAMAAAWDKVKTSQTPVVSGALQPWLKSVTDLTGHLAPIIAKVAPVIKEIGTQFDILVSSSAFSAFIKFIAGTGSQSVAAAGNLLTGFLDAVITLLPKFNPLIQQANKWVYGLGDSIARWANSQKTADHITAFMAWFKTNGPVVGGLLTNLGLALKAMAPGLTAGGALELKVISDFLGLVAKLPPGIAKPLFEVAGAALILNKMGGGKVISFLVTAAFGGLLKGGGAASGAAEAGGAASLWSKLAPGARLAGGVLAITLAVDAVLKGTSSGPGGKNWFDNPFGMPGPKDKASVNNWLTSFSPYENLITKTIPGWFTAGAAGARLAWSGLLGSVTGMFTRTSNTMGSTFTHMSSVIAAAMQATGRSADNLRTRNLTPLLGYAGQVSGGIQGLASRINPGLSGALNTGGQHADTFRTRNLGPLQGSLSKTSGGVQGLQGLINAMHGKTVGVGVRASGSGGMTFTEKVAASISSGGFSLRSLAAGGRLPGYGGGDRHPALLESGETVVSKEHSQTLAGAFRAIGVPGYAGGGIAGMVPWAANAGTGFARAVGADLLRKEFAHLRATVAAAAKANAMAFASPAAGGVPGSGVQRWLGTVQSALAQLGLSLGLANDVLYQMQSESGGNPTIVNTTDSNWLAGHPSVGLMQVIAGTFAAYAGPYRSIGPFEYGVSVNPLANIYAALNYGKHGRGFGSGPGQIGSGHGYDQGGWLMPGLTLAMNSTGRPEQVLPPGGRGGGDTYVINVTLPPGSDRDHGRRIVGYIKQYEKGSGPGWRK